MGINVEGVDVSEPVSISTSIAQRYAKAVFELALNAKGLDALESEVGTLAAALAVSADFNDLISSPIYSRDSQEKAVKALGAAMGLGPIMGNTLQLMATKRRLFVLPQMIAALRGLIAEHKGEITADVTSAETLSDAQKTALSAALSKSFGKDVKLNLAVDETLIGGLVVKVGSRMIDTSIRAKLNSLQNIMKEVG